jgi:hypothetical protein
LGFGFLEVHITFLAGGSTYGPRRAFFSLKRAFLTEILPAIKINTQYGPRTKIVRKLLPTPVLKGRMVPQLGKGLNLRYARKFEKVKAFLFLICNRGVERQKNGQKNRKWN